MIFNVTYSIRDKNYTSEFFKNSSSEHAEFIVSAYYNKFSLHINPQCEITFKNVSATMSYNFSQEDILFLNGYQSWTDSHELTVKDKMKGINHIPKFLLKKYAFSAYGDYDFADYKNNRGFFHGFSYAYIRKENDYFLIGSLCENSGFTAIYFDVKNNKIIFKKDCVGLKIINTFKAFDIEFFKGNENFVFDNYFKIMNIPQPQAKKITGFTSWYRYYQNINEKVILENLAAMSSLKQKFDVFQIDDGYQTAVGDWLSIDKSKFPNGLKKISQYISDTGMTPGIWLAPFACEYNSVIAKKNPDWLLKNKNGQLISGGSNWDGFYVLDFYNYEVRKYIKTCFDTIINDWGFKLLKLDFLYAVCLSPTDMKNRGQIMSEAMDFLRECSKGALILGCGVPLASAFGKVDYCRIGCDVGLDYDDKPHMRLLHRERISTKNSMGNTIFRRQLSGRAFINDPDVFLLRDKNIKLSQKQKVNLAKINNLFGGVLFTSDNVSEYNITMKKLFDSIIQLKLHKNISISHNKGKTIINTEDEIITLKL